ncbi:MAG: sodium:proton antiporter, partial [Muribaculaceae bacterium]|nr:sodium:proton antiporter [Muribaculaceae bacterium]
LDNMTTTIIMVMMLRRLIADQKERWLFAGIIVLAANSGGAWSPIGDVTTIMLWMAEKVSTGSLIVNLLLPSLVSVIIPVMIASRYLDDGEVMHLKNTGTNAQMAIAHPHISKIMLCVGVAGLLFVPVFKTLTGLPPFMGMMISLGVIWLITEILITRYHIDHKLGGRVTQAVRHIDIPSILFFLGILLSVSALQQAGVLSNVAGAMNEGIHEPYSMTTIIGALSSIVDNVPLVAACIKMFTGMVDPDPAYMAFFVEDGLFWHLLTFCAGVGGSLLIIGSAAGVVAMGIEKIPFFWYVKHITLLALVGYIAGIVLIWLEDICPYITI